MRSRNCSADHCWGCRTLDCSCPCHQRKAMDALKSAAALTILELADAGAINECAADDGNVAHGLSAPFYKALDKLADALGVSHPAASQEEVS